MGRHETREQSSKYASHLLEAPTFKNLFKGDMTEDAYYLLKSLENMDRKDVYLCDERTAKKASLGLIFYSHKVHKRNRKENQMLQKEKNPAGYMHLFKFGKPITYRSDIRTIIRGALRDDIKLYIHFVFDAEERTPEYYNAMTVLRSSLDNELLEDTVHNSLNEGRIMVLNRLINEAIDAGDRKAFDKYTTELKEFKKNIEMLG